MNVVFVHSTHPSDHFSVWNRCQVPQRAIARVYGHQATLLDLASFIDCTPKARELCAASDIIVIHRYLFGPVLKAVQYWKARDKTVLLDLDQPLNLLEQDDPFFAFWHDGFHLSETTGEVEIIQPVPLEQLRWGLRMVDGVTVPSARLMDDWKSLAHFIEVPDYLPIDNYLAVQREPHSGIILGFGAGPVSSSALVNTGLLMALEHVCNRRSQVSVLPVPELMTALECSAIPPDQLRPAVDVDGDWSRSLASIDIGLAPAMGEIAQRSGNHRLLSFMAAKIPWVASDVFPHRAVARYGWVVQPSAAAWEWILFEMVEHLDTYRENAAREPFLCALSQDIQENVHRLLSDYATVLCRSQMVGSL